MRSMRKQVAPRRVVALVLVAGMILVGAACSAPGSTLPKAPPTSPTWFAGDSLAGATAANMLSRPYIAAVGAAGFNSSATTRILDNTQSRIDLYGAPLRLLVMGGVNDMGRGLTTAQVTTAMQELEDAIVAQGIELRWVAEPAWQFAAEMAPVNDWVMSHPTAIDCRAQAGAPSADLNHPASYRAFADCIDAALAG